MQFKIHDVGHGSCVVAVGPEGHRLMLDCGYSIDRPWFPSIHYSGLEIQTLMITNLDEDHVEDLPDLWRKVRINGIFSNPTIDAAALRKMKTQGMRAGVQQAHDILNYFGQGRIGGWAHDLGGVSWEAFWNRYGDFDKTNNLSLAVFVTFGKFTILFGGDLEKAGWKGLLKNPFFVSRLHEVDVYVASHHGRENGRCDELFDFMTPKIIIFSDGPKQYSTQETADWYASRVSGIVDRTRPATLLGPALRKVVTTRKDGSVTINVARDGHFNVYAEKSTPPVGDIFARLSPPPPQSRSPLADILPLLASPPPSPRGIVPSLSAPPRSPDRIFDDIFAGLKMSPKPQQGALSNLAQAMMFQPSSPLPPTGLLRRR